MFREASMKNRILVIVCALVVFAGIALVGCGQSAPSNPPEKIGVIGAMAEEVDPLKGAASDVQTTKISGMEFYEGKLEGKDVVIVQCGMGKVNAGVCASTLINEFGCTKIINTGVAGSLDNKIDIGDIVVSTDAVQHDFTVEDIGFKKGEIPYTGKYAFEADESMRSLAVAAVKEVAPELHVFEGRVCTGDQFVSSKEQKEKILSDFGGLCCEMEGGAIAQVCHLNETPFVIVRAISDKADESESVNYETFKETSAANSVKVVRYMVEKL
jgi:adenosylhomocysteine nucleosidase